METTPKKYGVFISYSHEDVSLVSPIVKFISAMRKDLVFQDTKDLTPGKKWEPQLIKALDEAEIIIVFWCYHSANSEYVKNEFQKAIQQKKDILPVLLDNCELMKGLEDYQWIDLTKVIAHKHRNPVFFSKFNIAMVLSALIFFGSLIYLKYNRVDDRTDHQFQSTITLDSLNNHKYPKSSKAENSTIDTTTLVTESPLLSKPSDSLNDYHSKSWLDSLKTEDDSISFMILPPDTVVEGSNILGEQTESTMESTGTDQTYAEPETYYSSSNDDTWMFIKVILVFCIPVLVYDGLQYIKSKLRKSKSTFAGNSIIEKLNERIPPS